MPRSIQDIIDHADELADRIEAGEFAIEDPVLGEAAARIHRAVIVAGDAEREKLEAITAGRDAGLSWAIVGRLVGISGESARRQYAEHSTIEHP